MASLNVGNLGEYLREQRRNAQLSLRQLADAAGVSNPYLSQIERGLRKPSADILQQLAKALRISAETLYVQAGILDERSPEAAGDAAASFSPTPRSASVRSRCCSRSTSPSARRTGSTTDTPGTVDGSDAGTPGTADGSDADHPQASN